jgi:hypothetical protein
MRRFALCCCVALLAACAKTETPATDSAAAMAPAPPPPAPISLADVAGTWNIRSTPESGDTTVVASTLVTTADTTGWTLALPNRKPQPVRVVAVGGDSIVVSNGPYESVLRKGVKVTTESVYRLKDGKLVGTTVARYTTTGADSVLRLRTEGTRAP